MLTTAEYETAVQALTLTLSATGDPRASLVAMVAEIEFRAEFPTWPENSAQYAREAIRRTVGSGWMYAPPWLHQILSKVTQTPEIAQIIAKIADQPPDWHPPPPREPFDDWWLPYAKLPFINRVNFREYLRRLNAPTGPSVLFVNGPSKSGKSYSVELLYHIIGTSVPLEQRDQPLPIALVTLTRGMGTLLSPQRLAELIIERITNNPKPLGDLTSVTPDRQNEHLCDWIVENAKATGQKWWIVIDNQDDREDREEHDNSGDTEFTPVMRRFISKLVEMISIGKHRHRKELRLLITHYSPTLVLGVPLSQMDDEQLSLIGEVDLELFFRKLFQKTGEPPPPALAVQVAVKLALEGLPQDKMRLSMLNDRLRKVATYA